MLSAITKCVFVGLGIGLVGVVMCFPLFAILRNLRELGLLLTFFLIPVSVLVTRGFTRRSLERGILGGAIAFGLRYLLVGTVARLGHQAVRHRWRNLRYSFRRMPWRRDWNDPRQSGGSVLRLVSFTRKASRRSRVVCVTDSLFRREMVSIPRSPLTIASRSSRCTPIGSSRQRRWPLTSPSGRSCSGSNRTPSPP